jgi:hypothetical protein
LREAGNPQAAALDVTHWMNSQVTEPGRQRHFRVMEDRLPRSPKFDAGNRHLARRGCRNAIGFTKATIRRPAPELFAPVVFRFYEHTNYTRSQILSSDRQYYRKWPVRYYQPLEGTFTVLDDGDLIYITEIFSWTVMNLHQKLVGKSKLFCTVRFSTDNKMEIVAINEQRIN